MQIVPSNSLSMSQAPHQGNWTERFPALLGICLVLAACVTAWFRYPAGLPIAPKELSHNLLLAVIAAELGLGILLVSTRWRLAAWLITLLLILSAGLTFVIRGAMEFFVAGPGPNLGSQLAAGSVYFLVAAVLAIRLRILARPINVTENRKPVVANLTMIALWLALFIACTAVVTGRSNQFTAIETDALGNDRLVILHPSSWIGSQLPIAKYLSPQFDLTRGIWTIILYQHDCPKSQAMLSRYATLPSNSTSNEDSKVLLIELPPYDSASSAPPGPTYAKLTDQREWIAQTPVEIQIRNGIVTLVSLGLPSVNTSSTE